MRIEQTTDTNTITPLFRQWENEYKGAAFGMNSTVEAITAELEQWFLTFTGTLLVAYDGIEPIGFFAVFAVPSPFVSGTMALEKYWYAQTNHKMAGVKLFLAAKEWAKANNCSYLITSASKLASNLHDDVVAFFEKMGMQLFETSYIMKVD